MGSEAESFRVAVFIDWQNTYKTAREAFGWRDYPNEYGNYSPYQLARVLTAENGRGTNAQLVRVSIHRGLPSQRYDQHGYAANRRQAAAWIKENPEIVIPRLRPLRYDREGEPREKGVDVELALGAVEWTLTKQCEVVIIFSHDTDLVPLVEMLTRMEGPACIETVSWTAQYFNQRIRTRPPVYHHNISRTVFDRVETRVNYAHAVEG
ncbi:MAG: NYN domain-containing protein [Gaiellaceae bacterium]